MSTPKTSTPIASIPEMSIPIWATVPKRLLPSGLLVKVSTKVWSTNHLLIIHYYRLHLWYQNIILVPSLEISPGSYFEVIVTATKIHTCIMKMKPHELVYCFMLKYNTDFCIMKLKVMQTEAKSGWQIYISIIVVWA